MEGAMSLVSVSSSSSSSEQTEGDIGEAKTPEELWTRPASPEADEHVTLITDSMTVTSADQEKLLLLDKNTELRRINKEVMRLNEEWDQVYRTATLNLQQRIEALELENAAIKTLNGKLLRKIENQQSVKNYYERGLLLELKKNHGLQECIRRMESRVPPSQSSSKQGNFMILPSSNSGNPPRALELSPVPPNPLIPAASSPQAELGGPGHCPSAQRDPQQEVQVLKEQLQAMQCQQTQIYEADFHTEQKTHKHMLHENRRLRKKREEMCQQVALLQEQLKVYEDDFRRERSDKQMLQRLLKKSQSPLTDPVLIHRCNNERQPAGGDKRTQHEDQPHRTQHHPLCPNHQPRPKD
ncbi:unnamed protein product [Knipowitschia caucasica]